MSSVDVRSRSHKYLSRGDETVSTRKSQPVSNHPKFCSGGTQSHYKFGLHF